MSILSKIVVLYITVTSKIFIESFYKTINCYSFYPLIAQKIIVVLYITVTSKIFIESFYKTINCYSFYPLIVQKNKCGSAENGYFK